jgi:hypothetical protein
MTTETIQQAVYNRRYALGYAAAIACLPCVDSDCYYVNGWLAGKRKSENSVNAENSANLKIQDLRFFRNTRVFGHGIDEKPGAESALGYRIGYKAQQWGTDIIPIA